MEVKQDLTSKNQEPETLTDTAVTKANDLESEDIPVKFRNKDGSANVASLLKSYKSLEPLINEKAKWVKEKENLTSQITKLQSQNSSNNKGISNHSINFYEEALSKSSDEEKAKALIEQLKSEPSESSFKELEALFPAEIVKEVFEKSMAEEKTLLMQKHSQIFASEMHSAHNYLTQVVEKNRDELTNPVTAEIFNEAFMRFGAGLDSEWFFSKIKELKKSFIMEYQKLQAVDSENKSAKKIAENLTPRNNASGGTPLLKRNALDLTPQELDMMLDEFNSKH